MPVYPLGIRIGRAKTRSVVVQETSSTYPTWFTKLCHIPPENNHNLEAAKHRLVSGSMQSEFLKRDFNRGCKTDLDYLIIVEQFKLASSDRVRNQLGFGRRKTYNALIPFRTRILFETVIHQSQEVCHVRCSSSSLQTAKVNPQQRGSTTVFAE
jgi:hypothetical protein